MGHTLSDDHNPNIARRGSLPPYRLSAPIDGGQDLPGDTFSVVPHLPFLEHFGAWPVKKRSLVGPRLLFVGESHL